MTHEKAALDDLLRKIGELAAAEGAARVTRVQVVLGAFSHFTPAHFREHFEEASRGTVAEGAVVEAEVDPDTTARHAQGVVLTEIEVES